MKQINPKAVLVHGLTQRAARPVRQDAQAEQTLPVPDFMTERAAMELNALKREYYGTQITNMLDLPPSQLEKQRGQFPHAVLTIEAAKVLQSSMPDVQKMRKIARLANRAAQLMKGDTQDAAGAQPTPLEKVLANPMTTDVPAGTQPTPILKPRIN